MPQMPVDPRSVASFMAVVVASIASFSLAGQFCMHVLGYDRLMGFVPLCSDSPRNPAYKLTWP